MIDVSNMYSGYMWTHWLCSAFWKLNFPFWNEVFHTLKCAIQTIDPKRIKGLLIVYETLKQGARSHHNIGPSKSNNLNHHNWGISLASIIHTQSSTSQHIM
jgi:hypothetical protein